MTVGISSPTSMFTRRRVLGAGVFFGAGLSATTMPAAASEAAPVHRATVVTPDRVTGIVSAVDLEGRHIRIGSGSPDDVVVALRPETQLCRGWPTDLSSFTGGEHVTISGRFSTGNGEVFLAEAVDTFLHALRGRVSDVRGETIFTTSGNIHVIDRTVATGSRGLGEIGPGDVVAALVLHDPARGDSLAVQFKIE